MTQTALKLQLTDRQTADFEMIGNGGFAPLTGPQGSEDWKSVVENMTLTSGEYWPIPITLATDLDVSEGDTVEVSSDEGKPLGRLNVTEVFERDLEAEAENVYGTTDKEHPGVAAIYEEGARCIAGTYEVDELPDHEDSLHAAATSAAAESTQGIRGSRLEADRRLPDPQPDPPRARVRHQDARWRSPTAS